MVTRGLPTAWGSYGGVPVSPAQSQFIRQGVGQGLSLTRIQQALQQGGIGLRRQAISDIRREITGSVRRAPALRNVRDDFRPTAQTITPTSFNISTRYKAVGLVYLRDAATLERITINVNFGFDELMTIGEIKAHMLEIAEEYAQKYGQSIDIAVLDRIDERGF